MKSKKKDIYPFDIEVIDIKVKGFFQSCFINSKNIITKKESFDLTKEEQKIYLDFTQKILKIKDEYISFSPSEKNDFYVKIEEYMKVNGIKDIVNTLKELNNNPKQKSLQKSKKFCR